MLSFLFVITLFISSTTVFEYSASNHVSNQASYKKDQKALMEDHPTVELGDVTSEDNFGTQMTVIIQDFTNRFANLKSLPWSDSDSFPIPRYHSHVQLGNAVYMFIEDGQPTGQAVFRAHFPSSTVPAYAQQSYSQLKDGFEYYSYFCGRFEKGEEISNGNLRSQLYHIVMASDSSNLDHANMLIEIGIDQGETFLGSGYETTVWIPFVKVSEKG